MNFALIENNYLVIPNFICTDRAKSLAHEFKTYCETNNLAGDSQAENSHSVYNHTSFLELLCEKTPEISTLLEETVLPTYSYARVYKEGSVLEKHIDRDACEISITLHLDGDYPWPIWIETPQNEKRFISLNPGDAMLYLGRIAPHWREEYKGQHYSQVFLHYVRSRGECSYAYFDREQDRQDTNFENRNTNVSSENKVKEENNNNQQIVEVKPMLLKSSTPLSDFIKVYDNAISKELCSKILEEYRTDNKFWRKTAVGNGEVNSDIRNCSVISLSSPEVIEENFDVRKSIDMELHQQLLETINKYAQEFNGFRPSIDTGYDLLRYDRGEFYIQHTDNFMQQQRSVSCSLCINDDYVGGEFAFFDREIIMRPQVGSVIVFPSNFMYPHEVMPVIEGTRYSIITWYV